MKKHLFLLLIATPLLSFAQLSKGDKFIGGGFQFRSLTPINSNQGWTSETMDFSINPFFGFLVSDKLAIGGQVGYSYLISTQNADQPNESKYTSADYSAGLISRRYFSISEQFVFSIDANFNYGIVAGTSTNSTYVSKTKNHHVGASIKPTFIFFPSPKWGIEASIGNISYEYSKNLSTGTGLNDFNIYFGSIQLGLSYYFKKSE